MSSFLNIRSSRLEVSYKKVFLKFLQNSLKISKLSVVQSFFSQLTFGLLNSYCNSLVPCCFNFRNHTQKNCVIAFFDPLIRKHVTHAMHRNAVAEMPWVLENTGSFIFKKFENTVYARFTQELLQLIFIFFG